MTPSSPFHLDGSISRLVGRSVVVTGTTRSGTTMMGSLIHSMRGMEYAFEPPLLVSLLPLIDQVDEGVWRLLFETYLFEDFLMEAITGRRLNLNRHDDSCVLVAKAEEDVRSRMQQMHARVGAQEKATSNLGELLKRGMQDLQSQSSVEQNESDEPEQKQGSNDSFTAV